MIEDFLNQITIDPSYFGELSSISRISGGCICDSAVLTDSNGKKLFLKTGANLPPALLIKEAHALNHLSEVNCIRTPKIIAFGKKPQPYLILEYLEFSNSSPSGFSKLGRQLAKLHKCTHESFGWAEDNFVGLTKQINKWNKNWVSFFTHSRLIPQIQLAHSKGLRLKNMDRFLDKLPFLLEMSRSIVPSLLHGDLWSGNVSFLAKAKPVIYDPAIYYGDREIDLAMTRLFGGFPNEFYQAYEKEFPLDEGFQTRLAIYNLYPILNHFNLFGGHYGQEAQFIINSRIQ